MDDEAVSGKPPSIRTEELRVRLEGLPGFKRGYDRQVRIIRLGQLLRRLREDQAQLSQVDAAALLGMNQSELSRIEKGLGERGPSYGTITRIIEGYSKVMNERGAEVILSLQVTAPGEQATYRLTPTNDEMQASS